MMIASGKNNLRRLLVVAAVMLCGCGGTGQDDADLADLAAPEPPGKADEAYSVQGGRSWYLVGNALTAGDDRIELAVEAAAGTRFVDLWIDGRHEGRFRPGAAGYDVQADIGDLGPGEHAALLAADGGRVAFHAFTFLRSHPMYVFVTTDWDDPDNPDANLARQERLHASHPAMRVTHFVGPYTFTDPSVSTERAALLAAWVRDMRDRYGDEIGLHIHPYCSFVESAAVACRTSPSFAYPRDDATGYTVYLSSYTGEETGALLGRAKGIFSENGLGTPTSFRAGGWTVMIHTLEALAAEGFVADTSANNWRRLEEWEGYPGADLFEWNKEHWSTIDERSQPYYPSEADILSAAEPAVPILEVPDNGILVDYVTGGEMIEMFHANWAEGAALEKPTAYVIGYHPPNFSEQYYGRIDEALAHIDRFLSSGDGGPVVYATMSEAATVWPRPAP